MMRKELLKEEVGDVSVRSQNRTVFSYNLLENEKRGGERPTIEVSRIFRSTQNHDLKEMYRLRAEARPA